MIRRADITVSDSLGTPEPGVYITVKNNAGTLATLYNDSGGLLSNPLVSGTGGAFYYNIADGDAGTFTEEYRLSLSDAPRTIRTVTLNVVDVGSNVMAIGLFVIAATLSIPVGTNIVRTAGHSVNGAGIADYVADVAVDTAYVAANPLTSFRSLNARGFRIDASHGLSLPQTGGKADSSVLAAGVFNGTDNLAAYNAAKKALGYGGTLHAPQGAGAYRFTALPTNTEGIKLVGDGWHENPGQVGATTYIGIQAYPGTVFCYDANVGGLRFIGYTDNNANATAFEFQSSVGSIVEDLMLYGGGGTDVTAHGIEHRIGVQLRNVRIENFAGNGVKTIAYTAGASPWGNASQSQFNHVLCRGNKCHGFYIEGSDSNVITLIDCDASLNGGVGFLDKSLIGNNIYTGCHAATNNQSFGTATAARTQVTADWAGLSASDAGSFVTVHAGGQQNIYLSCYVETGAGLKGEITEPNIVIGGTLAETGSHTAAWTADFWHGSSAVGLAIQKIASRAGLSISHADGNSVDIINATGGTAKIRLRPGGGTYAMLQLMGNGDLIANGLEILAGSGTGYFSADSFQFRNAAQTLLSFTADANGINLDTGNTLKVGNTQVVAARETGWAADTGTAKKTATAAYAVGSALTVGAAYVQAEVTAIITRQALIEAALRDATQEIKALKDALITHGLIGA